MLSQPKTHLNWKSCDKANPCRVCGTPKWCSYATGGEAWKCRTSGDGTEGYYQGERTDKNGSPYHLYWRDPAIGGKSEGKRARREEKTVSKSSEPLQLAPDRTAEVYGALLPRLPRPEFVVKDLLGRGLLLEEIDLHRFCAYPEDHQIPQISREMFALFGEDLARVPGFYRDKDGSVKMVSRSPGWLLPYEAEEAAWLFPLGKDRPISGFRHRLREPLKDGSRYMWLSSKKEGGLGARPQAFRAGQFTEGKPRELILCEGEIKAIVLARHFGTVAISVPGVDLFKVAEAYIKAERPSAVIVAYDADREMVQHDKKGRLRTAVPSAHLRALQWVESLGYSAKALRWWTGIPTEETAKGPDDHILVGGGFEVLEGEDLEANSRELMQRFGIELAAPAEEKPEKPKATKEEETQIEALFRLADEHMDFFRDDGGKLYFAHQVKHFGGHQVLRTHTVDEAGKRLTDALRLLFYGDKGWPAKAESLRSVADILRTQQQDLSPSRAVSQRVQEVDGAMFIDLNDGHGTIVEVGGGAWRTVKESPARFLRRVGQGRLPVPEHGGSVEELFQFLNVRNHGQKQLAVCFIVQSLLPRGPYPVMVLEGEQGSGKTSFARVLAQFIDPLVRDVGSIPKDEENFAVQANASHLLVYDNVSRVPGWLPDLLCKSSTGGSLSKRQLHTDGELFELGLSGPVILTGITGLIGAADLLERVVHLQLERFEKGERKTEEDLRRDLEPASARIFGAILDVMAKAVAIKSAIPDAEVPDVRLRDFAKLSIAIGRVLGWEANFFEEAYMRMQQGLIQDSIESSPVVSALVRFLEANPCWSGTSWNLLESLKYLEPNHARIRTWPAAANSLTRAINNARTVLREAGWEYGQRRSGDYKRLYFSPTSGCVATNAAQEAPVPRPTAPISGSSRYSDQDIDALSAALPFDGGRFL